MGNRRQAREAALGYLYQQDAHVTPLTDNPLKYMTHFKVAEPFQEYFLKIVEGVAAHQTQIDEDIQSAAEHWKLYRMLRIDRSILRLACWELIFTPETPLKVVIDEGVELAKIYGSQDSSSFVNGILDKVSQKYRKSS